MANTVNLTDPRKTSFLYEEAIKTLRTNITFAGRSIKVVMVTSSYANEGKTDISYQLCKEIAAIGKKTILLDMDIRKASLGTRFSINRPVKGLSHYLCGSVGINDILFHTNIENMDIIFAGNHVPNPSELLEDEFIGALFKALRSYYDYVIVDTPPASIVTDASIISKWCDGCLFVIQDGAIPYKVAQRAIANIERSGCKILGAVLNKGDVKQNTYYNKSGYYAYEYDETTKNKNKKRKR